MSEGGATRRYACFTECSRHHSAAMPFAMPSLLSP